MALAIRFCRVASCFGRVAKRVPPREGAGGADTLLEWDDMLLVTDKVDANGRPTGEALESYALSHTIDLLVMGAYGHSRLREFILGGATKRLLSKPPLPILFSH